MLENISPDSFLKIGNIEQNQIKPFKFKVSISRRMAWIQEGNYEKGKDIYVFGPQDIIIEDDGSTLVRCEAWERALKYLKPKELPEKPISKNIDIPDQFAWEETFKNLQGMIPPHSYEQLWKELERIRRQQQWNTDDIRSMGEPRR